MSGLKQELGLAQGVGLLSTSLLGTGVFAVPAPPRWWRATIACGRGLPSSCWCFPSPSSLPPSAAIFPAPAALPHFVSGLWSAHGQRDRQLFLSVIPVGLPAALHIAAGFTQALFGWHDGQLLLAQLGTLAIVWWLGSRGASTSANLQTLVAILIVALIVALWWAGDITLSAIPFPPLANVGAGPLFAALAVMFWCFVGLEAFAHMAAEFKQPERDFRGR